VHDGLFTCSFAVPGPRSIFAELAMFDKNCVARRSVDVIHRLEILGFARSKRAIDTESRTVHNPQGISFLRVQHLSNETLGESDHLFVGNFKPVPGTVVGVPHDFPHLATKVSK